MNVYDFVDLDLEETTTDPLDRRDSSQSPSKELTNKLEVPPITRDYPSSPSKESFRRKMPQDAVNVRESSSSIEESPGLLTPQLGVSRTPSSHSLGKIIPRGGYLVNLLKYLVIRGGWANLPFTGVCEGNSANRLPSFLLLHRSRCFGLLLAHLQDDLIGAGGPQEFDSPVSSFLLLLFCDAWEPHSFFLFLLFDAIQL